MSKAAKSAKPISDPAKLSLGVRIRNKQTYFTQRLKGSPLPPTGCMFLVQGSHNASDYVQSGLRGWQSIQDTLQKSYINIHQFKNVLDFGCGCGRVLRYWKAFAKQAKVYGTDYNPELVSWCSKVVPFANVQCNELEPPLKYKDNSFDFIYALSTFTHWTVPLQHAWMQEFKRILQPGGILMFTVHGDYYLPFLMPEHRELYLANVAITGLEQVGTNQCGAYNPPGQVKGELLRGMELLAHYPSSALGNPWQDVYLVRKPS